MTFPPFSPIPLDHETYTPDRPGRTVSRYLVALAVVAFALAARLACHGMLGDTMAYTLFMPAVLIAAVYGGFGPGFLALVLGSVLGNYFFQQPYGTLAIADWAEGMRLGLSLLAGLFICLLGGMLKSARRRALADAMEVQRQSDRFRASDENYRRMFETAYEGILCLDDRDHVNYVNGRMVEMLGYSIIGMVGHPASDFVFPEDRLRLKSILDARRKGGKEVSDFRLRRKDGQAIFCIVSTQSIFDREGRYRGSLSMITDITARRWSAEDVNQLLDHLKVRVQTLHGMQQSALAGLPQSEGSQSDPTSESCDLDDVRQTIARSIALTEQISVLLRSGKIEEAEPATQCR